MKELKSVASKIIKDEHDIQRLEQLKEGLIKRKNTYYFNYFKVERPDYSNLTDIPPFDYFYQEQYKRHPIHPLAEYSTLNAILLGEFIKDLFKEYEQKDVASFLHIQEEKTEHYHDGGLEGYDYDYTPYVIIGNEKDYLIDDDSENIVIPLTFTDGVKNKDNTISCPTYYYHDGSRGTIYYPPYSTLISDYKWYGLKELEINTKGHEFIRDLIYNLAYYQKQHDIKKMTPEQTKEVYSKVYKK